MNFAAKFSLILTLLLSIAAASQAAEPQDVKHPYMLWTRQDAAKIRKTIETQPWAKQAYEQMVRTKGRNEDFEDLFRYLVMGEAEPGQRQKKKLLKLIDLPHPLGAGVQWRVLAYDVLYDELTPEQRTALEKKFRRYIEYAIKPGGTYDTSVYNNESNYARYDGENGRYTRTNWLPNIIFPWKISANLMAAAIGDEKLIRDTWAVHGSLKWYFDEYLGDTGFYMEELSKMGSTPGGLMLYCQAMRNLGLDELGYGYQGTGGASMKGHIESVILATFPAVDTGTNRWRYERMSAGDVRPWMPFQHATVQGYFPNGTGGNKLWQAHGAWGGVHRGNLPQWDGYGNFTPKMQQRMWLEWGHAIWPDAGFDYFLYQMRAPDEVAYTPTLYFQIDPIDQAKAPRAVSAVYPDRGFVMLRAKQGPEHWESPSPAVALRLTVEYAHHVNDQLALAGFYAHNRPVYVNGKPMNGYAFGYDRSIRSHAGIMVDGHIEKDDWGRTGSLEPAFTDDCTTRQDFNESVQFVAARTQERYPGVDETRALMLTEQYLLDVYHGHSDTPHWYHWMVHSYGSAKEAAEQAWPKSDDLAQVIKELSAVRGLETGPDGWSVTIRQTPPEQQPENDRLGKAFWSRPIGVQVRMLGQDGQSAYIGTPPLPENLKTEDGYKPAPVDPVTLVAARRAKSAVFAALHDPFEGKADVTNFEQIARTHDALAVRVKGRFGTAVDDRLMVRFGDKAAQPVTLEDDAESFTFAGHAFVRLGHKRVIARGDLRKLRLDVGDARPILVINGQPVDAEISDGVLSWNK
ncbi:MAG: hypothetical protein ACOCZE_10550 [Planctomycetota bacterium]